MWFDNLSQQNDMYLGMNHQEKKYYTHGFPFINLSKGTTDNVAILSDRIGIRVENE